MSGYKTITVALAPAPEATFYILMCGFVLFNMIAILMHYIAGMSGASVPRWVPRGGRRGVSYIVAFNAVLLALVAIDLAAWRWL
ncbi:MAG: hypothetical protein LBG62_07065 [Candidatus Methanoplasma sp.]|jgi:hypothetical protein|nr:hypothetical protein [Candidatus Methanoplasma sp.]